LKTKQAAEANCREQRGDDQNLDEEGREDQRHQPGGDD